ncbi:MAG: hypothetical protein P8168_02010 [Deltaproteobacteria bacterium]|jgi:hypothetical protein
MEIQEKKGEQPDRSAQLLPLVVEIIPGQAGEGLIEVYEPGSYEDKSLQELCSRMLAKKDWSIEDLQVLEDIQRQLDGGKLLARGGEIGGAAPKYASLEETSAGEKYWYIAVRAIKPQEGG